MITTLIGFIRIDPETGRDIDLYQCSKCKTIVMGSYTENPECQVCKTD